MPLYSVDAKTLSEWLKHNEAVLVDVREPEEHASGRIAGADLIPLGQVALKCMPPLHGRKISHLSRLRYSSEQDLHLQESRAFADWRASSR